MTNLVDIPMCKKALCINALNTVDFTDETVYDEPCMFRADKSPGVGGIYTVWLGNIANVIFKPLCHIFSQSLLCNVVQHEWMLSNATSMFNKGKKLRLVVTDQSV